MITARCPQNRAGFLALLALAGLPAAAQTDGVTSIPGRPLQAPGDPDLTPGQVSTKADGELFLVDANQGGQAEALRLVDLRWGRRVDVLGLAPNGAIGPRPLLRDFVIGDAVPSDGVNYRLIRNIDTQVERLVILREPGAPEPSIGAGTFEELLLAAESNLSLIQPKDPSSAPPFSMVARNAVLVARLDDLLHDSPVAAVQLFGNARLELLLPQPEPFAVKVSFDPNHGDIRRGKFHSTRLLIDPAITTFEAADSPLPLPVNAAGLPASTESSTAPNVVLRLPTQIDTGSGQFQVLQNLRGRTLATVGNGPVDFASPTIDLVRGMRSGNESDPARGHMQDQQPPFLVGAFPADITAIVPDPAGEAGFSFLLDMAFTTACRIRPVQANVLQVGGHSLEVVLNAGGGTSSGEFAAVAVRLQGQQPVAASELLGQASFLTTFRSSTLDPVCWLRLMPTPGAPPGASVSPDTQVIVRFSEAMETNSVSPFDSFRLLRGDGSAPATAFDLVVGERLVGLDLTTFGLSPLLPLDHVQGSATAYHVELVPGLADLTDVAGNSIQTVPTDLVFTLDPAASTEANGGVALSFSSVDELPGAGAPDLRGNIFHDLTEGSVRPRPVTFFGVAADRNKPVPGLMIPLASGVQTPLSPLGSKLQAVWRYADLGWSVRDETKYDVDVVGLSWAPVGGILTSDFFPEFEIRLAHGRRLPDEDIDANLLPKYPNSGFSRFDPFELNVLEDPRGPQKVVHSGALGYQVNPSDLFVSESGTLMTPFPLNQSGGPFESYTWRDTAVQAKAGPNGRGVPMDIEVGAPLFLEPQAGEVAPAGEVPSIGLPLLMEYRCYPTGSGLGLNAMDVSLAINSSAQPAFRAYSTGGINSSGQIVTKNPDTEVIPSGGFNPASTPPGLPTLPTDNSFAIGQVDLVTRFSRGHSVWIDTGTTAPDFVAVVREGAAAGKADVVIEFRGADGFAGSQTSPFDATKLDAYGELADSTPQFHGGSPSWRTSVDAIDGARYLQMHFSFEGDLETGAVAVLDGLGVVYLR